MDESNIQNHIVREKEYYRLLISMQVGLFLTNENYMTKSNKLAHFK